MARAEPLAGAQAARRCGARQDDGELLAAVASDDVDLATRLRQQHARQGTQQVIAAEVTDGVVVDLEIVDVDHQQRERQLVAPRARHLLGEALEEVAVVVEAGEAVGDGELLDATVETGVLDGDRRQGRQGGGELLFVCCEAPQRGASRSAQGSRSPRL